MKTTFEEFKNDLLYEINRPYRKFDTLYAIVFFDGKIVVSSSINFPDHDHYLRHLFTHYIDISILSDFDGVYPGDYPVDWISDLYEYLSSEFFYLTGR